MAVHHVVDVHHVLAPATLTVEEDVTLVVWHHLS